MGRARSPSVPVAVREAAARQHGMTLVELLVALTLGLLVVLAATIALTVARRGFTTVDAASQLRDSGRFSVDVINRVLVQAGFEDLSYAVSTRKREDGTSADPPTSIYGFNNALALATDPTGTRVAGGVNSSDVLVVRYQAGETYPGSGVTDGTMIDCQGKTVPLNAVPTNRDDRMASVFHVALSNAEPSLMCTTVIGGTPTSAVPVVQGVEDFQVLYGVDGVIANTAPDPNLPKPVKTDRYLRADQLTVTGNAAGTNANWRRVNSVRIGMLLRAAPYTAQDVGPAMFYPFGVAASASGGVAGSSMSSAANDPGTAFDTTGLTDRRLRQVVTFTVYLRNAQDLSNPVP
jgi:type IV pilus assembly protein PilW